MRLLVDFSEIKIWLILKLFLSANCELILTVLLHCHFYQEMRHCLKFKFNREILNFKLQILNINVNNIYDKI